MKKVLYVDDDMFLRGLMVSVLEEFGYVTVTAENGQEGEAVAMQGGFNLIITDYDMPVMKGGEMVRRLREQGLQTPIVMVSSTSEAEEVSLGIDGFLSKPYETQSLIDLIDRLVEGAAEPAA
ncbi:MAG: hypothetical protein UW32_C0003G0066 [Candidatus Wolfebacteria bacterium GW2011_GWE2_44_13]|uniref:Response regulatory domain-containing protein n=1 Tax=Candidatus Wolfebacteria bacterium GW2011_GWE2_44_13 TaxID=1619017 RepID=A0A0G1H8Y7_9BACT|nr:MAG: hypothetical protein UW32_C0003G0066 [Candidatus Wolfebacteria bacterium GW2011_GWE2_44_13]